LIVDQVAERELEATRQHLPRTIDRVGFRPYSGALNRRIAGLRRGDAES
jgi:hypothetical protein